MNRENLEHLIRAAADVTNEYEFIIIGSQSILGPIPHPPAELTMSMEADIYAMNAEEKSDKIDAPWEKDRSFTRRTATTPKALVRILPACLKAGKADCSGYRTVGRTIASAIAWIRSTCSWRRQRRIERKTASSISHCFATDTLQLNQRSEWSHSCLSMTR